MKGEILERVLEARAKREAVAVITRLADGSQHIVPRAELADDPFAEQLESAFRFDKSQVTELDGEEHFIDIHNPPLKMIIVGAVHIAQALIPIAQATGFHVVVIDPRGAFATETRFPGVELHDEWPDEVLDGIGIDARTAVIALTHDPKIDDPALTMALKADPFYIGALGSRRTHAGRLERLGANGLSEDRLSRINGPIGLNIGAKGQAEIAVAVMGKVIEQLRLGDTA